MMNQLRLRAGLMAGLAVVGPTLSTGVAMQATPAQASAVMVGDFCSISGKVGNPPTE